MKNEVNVYSISFLQLLTIVFVVLKLMGIITWSWWWVLAPLWIPVLLLIVFVVWLVNVNN